MDPEGPAGDLRRGRFRPQNGLGSPGPDKIDRGDLGQGPQIIPGDLSVLNLRIKLM
jgi:hypothetical protein